jgi:hypothetical protein
MLSPHQQITDETGRTFVLLPIDEYNALLKIRPDEDEELDDDELADVREALAAIKNGEPTISAEEVQRQLGLPALFPIK